MRAVLVLCVVACAACSDPQPGYGDVYGPGCRADSDCGNDVCSHTGECYPAAQLRTIRAIWTINGAAPDATSCGNGLAMTLSFSQFGGGYGNDISFEPVACAQGQFTLDKIPTTYNAVRLEAYAKDMYGQASTVVDQTTGDATLDLKLM